MIRSNIQRSKYAILGVWLVQVIVVINLSISVFLKFSQNLNYDPLYIGIIGVSYLYISCVIVLGSIITFIKWFRRAYCNLSQLVNTLPYKEEWAAGSWFVPIMNLYVPYQIMKSLYVEADRLLISQLRLNIFRLNLFYVKIWWILWASTWLIWLLSLDIVFFDLSYIGLGIYGDILYCAVFIPLSLITVRIIRDYTIAEAILADMGNFE